MAAHGLALGVELDQILGDREQRLLGLLLQVAPVAPADLGERRLEAFAPGIFLDLREVFELDEQRHAVAVLDLQHFALHVADFDLRHPDVAADAVIDVDHVIAGLQRVDVMQRHDILELHEAAAAAHAAEDVVIDQHRQLGRGQREAVMQAVFEDLEGVFGAAALDQHLREPLAGHLRIAEQHGAHALLRNIP